jgi:thiol:disulfide interchange protein DsbD
MSVPLLVTGLSAGSLLPRAGAWMIQVKHVFGVMLLAVALWMLNPVLSGSVKLLAWGGLLVFAAFLTPLFNARGSGESFWRVLSRAAGALLLTVGLAEVIGGLMGNTDPLEPIRPLAASSAPATRPGLRFERVATLAELDRVLAEPGKPVMLDFYADWCVSCIEMERFTFNDPTVMTRLSGARLIQVDVTRNSIEDRAIMRRYAVFGPPAMFFFDGSGREIREARLVGFLPADRFDTHLRRAFPSL